MQDPRKSRRGSFGYEGEIVRVPALIHSSSSQAVWAKIGSHRDVPSILLAGHGPLFSSTVAYFLGSTRTIVKSQEGALARIDVPSIGVEPKGVLKWMLTPRLSHKLGV